MSSEGINYINHLNALIDVSYGDISHEEGNKKKANILARILDIFITQAEKLGYSSSELNRVRGLVSEVVRSHEAGKIFRPTALSDERGTFVDRSSVEKIAYKEPPETAPELWLERKKTKGEEPSQFIERVYAEWIDCGLTTADVKRLDKSLYQAYYQQQKDENRKDDIGLPTITEQYKTWMERIGKDVPTSQLSKYLEENAANKFARSGTWRSRYDNDRSASHSGSKEK